MENNVYVYFNCFYNLSYETDNFELIMARIVECVPNFSEGRDESKINKIIASIKSVKRIIVLDVDPGKDTNRTVVTMVGEPEDVIEAAFRGIKCASEIIDMTIHAGTHPRMGSTDVCPIIPIQDVTSEECIEFTNILAKRVGDELNIPVFLYEKSAKSKDRIKLPDIRSGEYEGLTEKLLDPNWKPDYGPCKTHVKAGAVIIGCRDFLIAYNINLNTKDHRLATDIAFELREAGRSKRIPNPNSKNLLDGDIIRTKDGKPVKVSGLFKDVKAIGWYVDEYKRAQISINFNNYKKSSIHDVFDKANKLANERGVRITGSELVGLVPLDAMLSAGKHYLKKQGRSTGIPEKDIIECAVQSLGLNDVTKFKPDEKIIDYAVSNNINSLVDLDFLNELSRNSPAPGGGSVSALAGALGSSLSSMVASLTHEKKGMIDKKFEMDQIGEEAQILLKRLTFLIDEDTNAFNNVMIASRLATESNEDKKNKELEIEKANKYAAKVPLETANLCLEVAILAQRLIKIGNPNSVTDAAVAVEVSVAGLRGACLNVLINTNEISDSSFSSKKIKQVKGLIEKSEVVKVESFNNTLKIISGS